MGFDLELFQCAPSALPPLCKNVKKPIPDDLGAQFYFTYLI